ncbi:MAG: response regulator [Saccharospirillaceae bacterium]|jgi:CheY-like chemotaxis protein|nr:response regulator [Saccharospirillaceae bacterium]
MAIKNALVVDDSKSARMMLQRLLGRMNVKAEAVESAEAALMFLDKSQPDVIFMDHMMPGMDGLEATQLIKSNPKTSTIPTIMYTSKEGEEYFDIARSHGAEGVLAKPANQEAVMAVIESLDEPAANDERETNQPDGIALVEVDKLVQKHLKLAITEAKAEIAAGLDSSTQQLQSAQFHQLEQIQSHVRQQHENLQTELKQSLDPQTIYKATLPLNQRLAAAVADKVNKKAADDLVTVIRTNKAENEALIASQTQNLQKQIQQASLKAMIIGAVIGGGIGAMAAVAMTLI